MSDRPPRLEGKVAIITGAGTIGPGVGNGKATAVLFAREGAKVLLVDIVLEAAEETLKMVLEEGGEASTFQADVSNAKECENMVKACVERYGRVDILVNNVGISSKGDALTLDEAEWDKVMDVKVKGVFLGTQAAIPEMSKAGGGSIINISSIYGLVGSGGSAAYHASKGAVRIFNKSTAIQYASENIRANSVHPGFIDTPMTRGHHDNPKIHEERVAKTPIGRMGQPEDIAAGILFLASDESSFMTGAELVIDGGMTAQ